MALAILRAGLDDSGSGSSEADSYERLGPDEVPTENKLNVTNKNEQRSEKESWCVDRAEEPRLGASSPATVPAANPLRLRA